jgi:iron complex outermembrane receptor protein
MQLQHQHLFGAVAENDRHRTGFGEVAMARSLERATLVAGVALQGDVYRADELPAFNYSFTTKSAFAQAEVDPTAWIGLSASARIDAHSEYGTFVNPRLAVLLRAPNEWTARVSAGTGAFAPTPFTEETEVIGLTQIQPLRDVRAERATTYSFDAGGPAGPFELNATLFGSQVRRPLALVAVDTDPGLRLVSAAEPTRTTGGEVFARLSMHDVTVTASYAHVRSRELDLATGTRRDVPLTPRNTGGLVGMWEEEDRGRVGFEFYYTGRQSLDDNPFRAESRAYLIVGALVEWHVAWARVFLNAENIGDVRQTRFDSLVRPTPGRGGRWTTDAWTELSGRTFNGGMRFTF